MVLRLLLKGLFLKNVNSVNIYFHSNCFQPSLNPEYEREPNQNKSLAAGVWGK